MIRPSSATASRSPVRSWAKSWAERAISGTGWPYMASATMEARAKNVSTPVVMMAAGAVPALIASSSTAVVVEDPRVNGKHNTHPAAICPDSGCRRSMISPV